MDKTTRHFEFKDDKSAKFWEISVTGEILPQLNGRKILIAGNHDPFFKRLTLHKGHTKAISEAHEDARTAGFDELAMDRVIDIEGIGKVRLNHFPYANPEGEPEFERQTQLWPKPGHEHLLMHGHVHSRWSIKRYTDMPPMLNVGVDVCQLSPVSESEVVRLFETNKLCNNSQGFLVSQN